MKAVFWLGIFNANISLTFQAVKNLVVHPTYVHFRRQRFGDCWGYLGINNISQRIKIDGNRKSERFDVVL